MPAYGPGHVDVRQGTGRAVRAFTWEAIHAQPAGSNDTSYTLPGRNLESPSAT